MRILIATHGLSTWAGTETYVFTLAPALVARGHDVVVFSPFPGNVSAQLENQGIRCTAEITDLRGEYFSVAHVHHNITATQVRSALPDVPMVWVRHGVTPELEQPPTFVPEVVLAVSPERALQLSRECGLAVELVPNHIDTELFAPERSIRTVPRTALTITNHLSTRVRAAIWGACSKLDIAVRHVGLPDNPVPSPRAAIEEADLVFAVGRSALEAASMGRAVLLLDHNGCDGWLDRANYSEVARFAFSGHRRGTLPTADELVELIATGYAPEKGIEARALVVEHHSLEVVVPQLERHYQRAIDAGLRNEALRLPRLGLDLAAQFAHYQRRLRKGEAAALRAEEAAALKADEAAALRAELERVHATRSWRLTAPLRSLEGRVVALWARLGGRRSEPREDRARERGELVVNPEHADDVS